MYIIDEDFIYVSSNERDCLLFKVLRIGDSCFLSLLADLFLCLVRGDDAPQRMECVHVERQVVQFSLVVRYRRIDVVVEFGKCVYEFPDLFV